MLKLASEIKALGESDPDNGGLTAPEDDYGNDESTTHILEVDATVKGVLETPSDADWSKVNSQAEHSYLISVNGAATENGTLKDPFVSVFGVDGKLLASNDNGGVGTNAQISHTAKENGVFFVAVSSFGLSEENSQGSYEVMLKDNGILVSDDYSADSNTASLIVINKNDKTGSIVAELEQLGDKDWHAVELKAGEKYVVELKGTEGPNKLEDPYVKIFDENENLLASVDDGGENANSMLRFSPKL